MKRTFSILIGGMETPVIVTTKRIRNMYLRVNPDGSLAVSCGSWVTDEEIRRFIWSRETWVLKTQLSQQRTEFINREGTEGPVIWWMGEKKYARYLEGKQDSCSVDGELITFFLREETDERITKAFRAAANQELERRVQGLRGQWDSLICMANGLPVPEIRYRFMTSRWGVCYPAEGRITLSTRLIHYPEEALEYVLLHEYVHFLIRDHSKRFYAIVEHYMPAYQAYSALLK